MPLFCRAFWLDAVCGPGAWDVALVERGGSIVGALPFFIRRAYGFTHLDMPRLTQFLGPWLRYPDGQSKSHSRLSFEKEILSELIDKLPPFDSFRQNFGPAITNWLPLFWKGFSQTTRYTYVLDNLSDREALFREFRSNIKTDIKKAQKSVRVVVSDDIERLYRVNALTFDRQSRTPPYDLAFLARLDRALSQRGRRRILLAEDAGGAVHAGVYLVWDENSAYYLVGGGDPALRGSGATSLLIWEAIQFAATVTQRFDFEGSMMEPVERFVRAFGAAQRPYFQITKIGSRKMRMRRLIEELAGLA